MIPPPQCYTFPEKPRPSELAGPPTTSPRLTSYAYNQLGAYKLIKIKNDLEMVIRTIGYNRLFVIDWWNVLDVYVNDDYHIKVYAAAPNYYWHADYLYTYKRMRQESVKKKVMIHHSMEFETGTARGRHPARILISWKNMNSDGARYLLRTLKCITSKEKNILNRIILEEV
jgi:hypothetical protein